MRFKRLPDNLTQVVKNIYFSHREIIHRIADHNSAFDKISTLLEQKADIPWVRVMKNDPPTIDNTYLTDLDMRTISGRLVTYKVIVEKFYGVRFRRSFGYFNPNLNTIAVIPGSARGHDNSLIHEVAHAWLNHNMSDLQSLKLHEIGDEHKRTLAYRCSRFEVEAESCAIVYMLNNNIEALNLATRWLFSLHQNKQLPSMNSLSTYIETWLNVPELKEYFIECLTSELDFLSA